MSAKVITFYNKKGGVGKTTLSVLFASYLAYGCGAKVKLFDFEYPDYPADAMRTRDIEHLKGGRRELQEWVERNGQKGAFKIEKFGSENYTVKDLREFFGRFQSEKENGGLDYIVVDFPASYNTLSPTSILLASHCVDLCVIPTDTSSLNEWSAWNTHSILKKNEVRSLWLWNNLSWYDKTQGVAAKHERQLTESLPGVEFAPWAVKAFTKAKRESDSKYFVMNTLCWPEDNVKRYVPELPGLFEWIKERLDTFISG